MISSSILEMVDSARIDLLKTLVTKAVVVQKLDDRFGKLVHRLDAILQLLQSSKTYVPIPSDFDRFLQTIHTALEMALQQTSIETLLSQLNEINSRLLQQLISLTNDPKKKIELYSAVLRSDGLATKQKYEDELRERLALRKLLLHAQLKDFSVASKKALQALNTQFKSVIKAYTDKCIDVHGILQVRGLEQISQDFESRFYAQNSTKNPNTKLPLITPINIPLQSAHVTLRLDKASAFERQQARDTMTLSADSVNGYNEDLWTKLAEAPYMPSLMERDRFVNEHISSESFSPASVLQKHRWIVVLGDPGSGKTTFVRWLTLKFAQAFKQDELLIKLPTITENNTKLEGLAIGPTRVPILIRVGEYGDALLDDHTLSLFDYIGRHQWIGQTFVTVASTTERNRAIAQLSNALKSYIQAGQALIILDGLDEIPASEQRHRIVDRIESFVEQFVQSPSCVSAFDQEKFGFSWSQLPELDLPVNSGGNQILVTSRIVGYHAGPLKGNFAHFTLEPLVLSGISSFIDHWFDAVHRQLLRALRIQLKDDEITRSKVQKQVSTLKTEISNANNKGLRELASNPLLLSVVCMISLQSYGKTTSALPVHRVCLYQDAVQWMLSSWHTRDSLIDMNSVKFLLCNIAAYIHQNSASGLIEHSMMMRLCSEGIVAIKNEDRVSKFVRIIREEVGVLAARGEFVYGFLHLTFQEYFVALHILDINIDLLTEKIERIAHRFFEHISDPRYREPLFLALGLISWKCSAGEYDSFCCELLSKRALESEVFASLVPLGAMLFVSSINELVQLPSTTLIFEAFDQLLDSAAEHQWHLFYPSLEGIIASGLLKLPSAIAKRWGLRFLTSPSISIARICEFCHVLLECGRQITPPSLTSVVWLDQQIVDLLWTLLSFEYEDEELIIDSTLVQLVQVCPAWFDSPRLRFRTYAKTKNIIVPPSLLSLVIALYGGLRRNEEQQVHFSANFIHRESSLSPLVIRYFHPEDKSSREIKHSRIIDYCNRIVKSLTPNDHSLRAVDSFLALFCLTNMKDFALYTSYTEYKAFKIAQKRIKRILITLTEFYFSSKDCPSSDSKDCTDIVAELFKINKFDDANTLIRSSMVNDFLNNVSAITSALHRLGSRTKSFLFPGQKGESDHRISLPPIFFQTKFIQQILSADNNATGLPNFLRQFWSLQLDLGLYQNTSYQRCVEIDCLSCSMALCHDITPLFALAFLPQIVEKIYVRLFTHCEFLFENTPGDDNKEIVHEVQLLTECLLQLHDRSCCKYTTVYLLFLLHPLLKKNRLENVAASFIWALESNMLKKHYYTMINITLEPDLSICQTVNKEDIDDVYGEKKLDNEEEIISDVTTLELNRLEKILIQNALRDDRLLYSSTVSLIHICWFAFDSSLKWQLLKRAIETVRFISNRIFKLHALTVIISHPRMRPFISTPLLDDRILYDEFQSSLQELSLISSPMIATLLIVRCLPLVDTQELRTQLTDLLLANFYRLNTSFPDDAQILGEILSDCSSVKLDPSFVKQQKNDTKIREMKSSILFNIINSYTTISYTSSQQITLAACHLAELAYDVQTARPEQDALNSYENMTNSDKVLSASVATHITTQIQTSAVNLDQIENQLHSFEQVSFAASKIVEQWLYYKKNELKVFIYHAALLLAYSNIWSVLGMNTLCDLLLSKVDRFRQRAEFILRSRSLPWRTSQLGFDVFLTLIEKSCIFKTTSPYASLMILWAFGKTQIDDIDHLIELLTREKKQIEVILKNVETGSTNVQNNDYLVGVLNTVSTPVLCHFVKTIEDEIENIIELEAKSSLTELQIKFVEHLLHSVDIYNKQENIFLGMCTRILNNDLIHRRIRQATVVTLGYSSKNSLPILKAEIEKPMSVIFLSITLDSYCRCVSTWHSEMTALERTTTENSLEIVIRLLVDSSEEVSQAAANGLARIYATWDDGLNILLKCLNQDHLRAYFALKNATKDRYVSSDIQKRIERVAELVEQHPSQLLPLFVLELFQSIEKYDSSIYLNRNIVEYHGRIAMVEIAAILVHKMPAAFCAEVNQSENSKKIKRALFYTSKQHCFPRRAACVAVLAAFGDLTSDMCDMFITSLLDSPWLQRTAYECVSRVQRMTDTNVIGTLLWHMSSESLIARYTVAKLLVHLNQQGVISTSKVQAVLSETIKDPTSKRDLWISTATTVHSTSDDTFEYIGRLDKILYTMLVEMSFSISKLLFENSMLDKTNYQSSLAYHFQQTNTPSYCASFSNIGNMTKVSLICDYILGSRYPIDFTVSNINKNMFPILYQTLWWKEERMMTPPLDIAHSLVKLYGLARKHDMDAQDLVLYALKNVENTADEKEVEKNKGGTSD